MRFWQIARNYTYRKRYLPIYANEMQYLKRIELLIAVLYKKSVTSKDVKAKRKYRLLAIKVSLVFVLMLKEPDITISRPINNRKGIASFSDSDCKTFFGFNNQCDLFRLLNCLRLNTDRIVLSNSSVLSGEEILLRGLYELVTGEFQSSVAINVFGTKVIPVACEI